MPKPCPSNTINDAPYQALAQEAVHSTGVGRPSWHRVNGQAILLRYWAVAFQTYAHDGSVLNLDVGLNCASSTAGVQFCAKSPSVSSSVMLEATSFSFGVRVGLVFMVQAGSVSLIAVMGLLIWLAVSRIAYVPVLWSMLTSVFSMAPSKAQGGTEHGPKKPMSTIISSAF